MTALSIKNLETVKDTLTLLKVAPGHHVLSSVRDGWFSGRRITVLTADEYSQFTATHSRWRGADCRRLHVAEIVSLFQKTLFSFRENPPDSPLSPLSPKGYIQLMEQGGVANPEQNIVEQAVGMFFPEQVKQSLEIFDQCVDQAFDLVTHMSERALEKRTPTAQESGWARWLLNVQRWIWHLWQSPIKRIERMKKVLVDIRVEISTQMILTARQRIQTNALTLVKGLTSLHKKLRQHYLQSICGSVDSCGALFGGKVGDIQQEENMLFFDKPYRENAIYLHGIIKTIQKWRPSPQ